MAHKLCSCGGTLNSAVGRRVARQRDRRSWTAHVWTNGPTLSKRRGTWVSAHVIPPLLWIERALVDFASKHSNLHEDIPLQKCKSRLRLGGNRYPIQHLGVHKISFFTKL